MLTRWLLLQINGALRAEWRRGLGALLLVLRAPALARGLDSPALVVLFESQVAGGSALGSHFLRRGIFDTGAGLRARARTAGATRRHQDHSDQ